MCFAYGGVWFKLQLYLHRACAYSHQLQLKIKRLHVCQAAWIVRLHLHNAINSFGIILLFRCGEFVRVFLVFFWFLLYWCACWGFCGYTNQRIVMVSSTCLYCWPTSLARNLRDTCKMVYEWSPMFLVRSKMKYHWPHHIIVHDARDFGRWLKCIVRMTNIHVLRFKT